MIAFAHSTFNRILNRKDGRLCLYMRSNEFQFIVHLALVERVCFIRQKDNGLSLLLEIVEKFSLQTQTAITTEYNK